MGKISKKLAVIVPCYNAEKYVAEMLDSVISQTYADFSIIVVDDCSTDSSCSIVEDYASRDERISLVHTDHNGGEAYARNWGLNHSTSDYVAIMDADDIMPKARLEIEMQFMENNPNCDVVFGQNVRMKEDGTLYESDLLATNIKRKKDDIIGNESVATRLLLCNVIPNATAMVKREFIDRNNIRYDDSFVTLTDYNFWVDCAIYGATFGEIDSNMQFYRVVENGLSRSNSSGAKLKERNEKFDFIHKKLISHFDICLNKKELNTLLVFTREERVTFSKRLLYIVSFFSVYFKLMKCLGYNDDFKAQLVCFRKKYYHF